MLDRNLDMEMDAGNIAVVTDTEQLSVGLYADTADNTGNHDESNRPAGVR